jgi:glutaredoxin
MSILVYTKPGCGECGQAKTLITLKGDTYQEVNLSSPQLMEGFKENFPAVRQMPHIIMNAIEAAAVDNRLTPAKYSPTPKRTVYPAD